MRQQITTSDLFQHYLADLKLPVKIPDGRVLNNSNMSRVYKLTEERLLKSDRSTTIALDGSRNVFVWSDIHFGHNNIIKYSNRPFATVDHMNESLMNNYKAVVGDDDIVIWGGDIAFMPADRTNAIVGSLPGYKVLIVGNHDFQRRSDNMCEFTCFDEVHICMSLHTDDLDILVTHYPLQQVPGDTSFNLHGHIHTALIPGNKHYNMCVEHVNYAPANINSFIERMRSTLCQ